MRAWVGVAEGYRRSFARACAGAVEPLLAAADEPLLATSSRPQPAPSHERSRSRSRVSDPDGRLRHLDVGCGDGRLAAAAAMAGRAVVACDADAAMCELARASTPDMVTVNAALPRLPWRARSFDVVTANFVVNHVDAPRAGVAEMARVCRSGGIVAGTIWPADGAGVGPLLREVFALPELAPLPDHSLPTDQDFERTRVGLEGLCVAAGLDDVRSTDIAWTWTVSPADLWAGITAGVATPGMTYLAQSPDVRARMTETFFATADAMSTAGTLTFDARAVLATGCAS